MRKQNAASYCVLTGIVSLLLLTLREKCEGTEAHQVTARLKVDKAVGVALGELSATHPLNSVEVTLRAPDDYLIKTYDLRNKSGTAWASTSGMGFGGYPSREKKVTLYVPLHSYGTKANDIHAVGFHGELIPEPTGPGDEKVFLFDASLADIDIDVDSARRFDDAHWTPRGDDAEDECEKGEGGGVPLPAGMYEGNDWPETLGQNYKILRLNVRPSWSGHPDPDVAEKNPLPKIPGSEEEYVGTVTLESDVPGMMIYEIGGGPVPGTIYVPKEGLSNLNFGLLTNSQFGAESGTITATFTWHSSIASGSGVEAMDVVRVTCITPLAVSKVWYKVVPEEGAQHEYITHDSNTQYRWNDADPHWSRGAPWQAPTCYTRNSRIRLHVTFTPLAAHSGASVEVRGEADFKGEGGNNLSFAAREGTLPVGGQDHRFDDWDCAHRLKNEIDIADPLVIHWTYRLNGETVWSSAGHTSNQVYVTRAAPLRGVDNKLFHTVLHVSCTSAQGKPCDNEQAIVDSIWLAFKDRSVHRTSDNESLKYYSEEGGNLTTTGPLLRFGTGQCGAWVAFFLDCLGAQGIRQEENWVDLYVSSSDPRSVFFVKEWTFRDLGGLAKRVDAYKAEYPYINICRVPAVSGDQYSFFLDEAQEAPGIAGQGPTPNPRSIFNRHFVARFGDVLYDPSYGGNPYSEGALEANIAKLEEASIAGYAMRLEDQPLDETVWDIDFNGDGLLQGHQFLDVYYVKPNPEGRQLQFRTRSYPQ